MVKALRGEISADACINATRETNETQHGMFVAAVQSAGRKIAHRLGAQTEPYRVFTAREIRETLASHGFRITREHRQFVLPIAFHKLIGSRGFSRTLEQGAAAVGLLALAGSPVTVLAER